MTKWMIFINKEFPLDDGGWDYMEAEFDGVAYDSQDAALEAMHEAQDDPRWAGETFYIRRFEV